jgi:hypothetical protein
LAELLWLWTKQRAIVYKEKGKAMYRAIDINNIRATSEQALSDLEAGQPHPLSEKDVDQMLATIIATSIGRIESVAAGGGKSVAIGLTHNILQSTLLGPYYKSGDYEMPTRRMGYYDKRYLKYYTNPSNLNAPGKRIYAGVHEHFTRAGFSVAIEFVDLNPGDDSPMSPSICIRW